MKRLMAVLAIAINLTSCGNIKQDQLAACYHGQVGDSNSVFTVDSQNGEELRGSMSFVFAQKDSSYGTYIGKLKNGKFSATYTFWSEGVQSVGEYKFLQSGKNFTGQGYVYMPATDCHLFIKK
jgi:hypothetical protein